MSLTADKKRWDDLHADQATAREAASEYERQLGSKYGYQHQRSWLGKGERDKLERLEARTNKIGDKIVELLVRVSPRGETWLSGTPAWWIRQKLSWEDAIRPKDEPLSVVVPGAYGYRDGYVKEQKMGTRSREEGIGYADEQIESGYFMDWVRDQLLEASRMDPNDVLPLETKADAKVIARNMLKQLEWDTKHDLSESRDFFKGFSERLRDPSVIDWLADEILEINQGIRGGRGGGVEEGATAAVTWIPNGFDAGSHAEVGRYFLRTMPVGDQRFVWNVAKGAKIVAGSEAIDLTWHGGHKGIPSEHSARVAAETAMAIHRIKSARQHRHGGVEEGRRSAPSAKPWFGGEGELDLRHQDRWHRQLLPAEASRAPRGVACGARLPGVRPHRLDPREARRKRHCGAEAVGRVRIP
jgi:hypothetical protein